MDAVPLVDTHAHLCSPLFAGDLDAVLGRARACKVECIIVVSQTVADARDVLALAVPRAPLLRPALGLHPVHVATLSDEAADAACADLEALIAQHGATTVVALGEVGLDFTPRVLASGAGDVRARQRRVFARLLRAATVAGLPATVHSRGAGRHALALVADVAGATVCMHAFDGRAVHAERALAGSAGSGIFFSVPPSIVRDAGTQKLVRRVPLDRLMLESDAPALGPVAGERNEPANVTRSVEMIAALKGITIEEVTAAIHANTMKCFSRIARNQTED